MPQARQLFSLEANSPRSICCMYVCRSSGTGSRYISVTLPLSARLVAQKYYYCVTGRRPQRDAALPEVGQWARPQPSTCAGCYNPRTSGAPFVSTRTRLSWPCFYLERARRRCWRASHNPQRNYESGGWQRVKLVPRKNGIKSTFIQLTFIQPAHLGTSMRRQHQPVPLLAILQTGLLRFPAPWSAAAAAVVAAAAGTTAFAGCRGRTALPPSTRVSPTTTPHSRRRCSRLLPTHCGHEAGVVALARRQPSHLRVRMPPGSHTRTGSNSLRTRNRRTSESSCRKSCSGTCCYGTAAHVTLKERSDLKAHETRWTHSSYQINRRDSGNNTLLTFE
jgi:hypothetical protein